MVIEKFGTLEEFEGYVSKRANNLRLTPPRPVKVVNAEEELQSRLHRLVAQGKMKSISAGQVLRRNWAIGWWRRTGKESGALRLAIRSGAEGEAGYPPIGIGGCEQMLGQMCPPADAGGAKPQSGRASGGKAAARPSGPPQE